MPFGEQVSQFPSSVCPRRCCLARYMYKIINVYMNTTRLLEKVVPANWKIKVTPPKTC